MKHRIILASLAAAAAMTFSSWQAVAADTITIDYASYVPPQHPTNKVMDEFFSKVQAQTNNTVVFRPHFGASLLGAKDIPSGVRDGMADSGYMLGMFVPSLMPVDNYISDFAPLNDDPVAVTGAIIELNILDCPQCKKEYEQELDVKYLASYALTPYLLQCKGKKSNIADFKSAKVRGFAAIADMVRAVGAIPVPVTTNEMYEALNRGIIDCTAHMAASQQSFSLGEVAKYVITNPLGGYMGGSLFNLRLQKWAQLSPKQRTAILENLPAVVAQTAFNYLRLDREVEEQMKAKGNEFYPADKDLADFISDFRKDYIANRVVAQGEKRGVTNPGEIKEKIIALKAKWIKLLDENGRDEATFEKLLWEQIYSKVPVDQ